MVGSPVGYQPTASGPSTGECDSGTIYTSKHAELLVCQDPVPQWPLQRLHVLREALYVVSSQQVWQQPQSTSWVSGIGQREAFMESRGSGGPM